METLEVEGDWKNFSFHIAQGQHCHAIASRIRQHDWREDPLDKHFCNMQMRSPFCFSDSTFYGYTEQNLSLVAFDMPNGKVAGVQLNSMKPKSAVLLMAVINKPFPVHQTRKEVAKAQLLQRINTRKASSGSIRRLSTSSASIRRLSLKSIVGKGWRQRCGEGRLKW
ncbi:hypothetical protein Ocin01_18511 [Orchesella cincta]|uniref:Uncharacterized protein n=1 Tax=Orchesella cincta TaxID=48709 RepID=A0A1D2M5I3_ORCCI|nr:hypothetical protein Ocin01_18511 [Orchesella cincta]